MACHEKIALVMGNCVFQVEADNGQTGMFSAASQVRYSSSRPAIMLYHTTMQCRVYWDIAHKVMAVWSRGPRHTGDE